MKVSTLFPRVYLLIMLSLILSFTASALDNKVIKAWTYYRFPPFITGDNQGLTYDFVKLLNEEAKGKYKFEVVIYPRKRLDENLDKGNQGIVLFVHWSWMKDKEKTKYLWGPSIMSDRNEIVSLVNNSVEYNGSAESLYGMSFGGILGRQYVGLMQAIKKGQITRTDARSEEQNIQRLLNNNIDVTTMPRSMLNYFIQEMELEEKLYKSSIPMSEYTRHILVTKELNQVHYFLVSFVENLKNNPQWNDISKKYGF